MKRAFLVSFYTISLLVVGCGPIEHKVSGKVEVEVDIIDRYAVAACKKALGVYSQEQLRDCADEKVAEWLDNLSANVGAN